MTAVLAGLDGPTLGCAIAAAVVGGALNAVAGGGSFIAFPVLICLGLPPIAANATTTLALWPGSLGSAWAYRAEIATLRDRMPPLLAVSLIGGAAGAGLLLALGDSTFASLVPWLMALATVLFAVAPPLVRRLGQHASGLDRSTWWMWLLQFAIAVYGGYFGGGMGILMLAVFALAGIRDVHAANGLKSLLGVAINGAAIGVLASLGPVRWPLVAVMVVGSLAGGYLGARTAKRLPMPVVRGLIVATGAAMTVIFSLRG